MKSVFHFKSDKRSEVKDILEDDVVSRLSINQRDCESLGFDMDGFFVMLDGDEDRIEEASEKFGDLSEELDEETEEEVIEEIERVEKESMESFGSIFG